MRSQIPAAALEALKLKQSKLPKLSTKVLSKRPKKVFTKPRKG